MSAPAKQETGVVTMKDVAQELGVSLQSVSAVLNGKADKYRISPATCERVTQMAQQMGYQLETHLGARQLAASKFGHRIANDVIAIIAACGSDSEYESAWSLHHKPYSGEILRGIEDMAHHYGMDVLICRLYDNRLPRLLEKRAVDGIIPILSIPEIWQKIAALDIPTVKLVGPYPGIHNLLIDNRSGIRQVVEHLAGLGHRHIAYIGHPSAKGRDENVILKISSERVEAFREAMEEMNLSTDYMDTSLNVQTREAAAQAACAMLQKHPEITAFVCYNDILAMGVIEGAQSLGLQVPLEISVTGFDDWTSEINYTPRITSVNTYRYQLGKRAVEMMWEARAPWLKGESFPLFNEIQPVTLSVHQSTAKARK